jgi:superfamily II DNA or RNA helicase
MTFTITDQQQELIENLLENFNFDKVLTAMTALAPGSGLTYTDNLVINDLNNDFILGLATKRSLTTSLMTLLTHND